MSHKDRVIERAKSLSTMTATAINKITPEILSSSASEMQARLGTDYDTYVSLFNITYDINQSYDSMTSDQKKLSILEKAESCFVLSILSISLKKVEKDIVIAKETSFAGTTVGFPNMSEVETLTDKFRNDAINCINQYYALLATENGSSTNIYII